MSHPDLPLTPRRHEIAILMTEGWSLDEIARMLTITPEAVADDIEYILQRLDSASRAEVASWATEREPLATASVRHLRIVNPDPGRGPREERLPPVTFRPDGTPARR